MCQQDLPHSPAPLWQGPKESRAHRKIESRSKGSSRVLTVLFGYRFYCESYLERDIAYSAATNPDVIDIQEQLPPIVFPGSDGKTHLHYFDQRFTLKDGTKLAVAVKPSAKAEKDRLADTLRTIASNMPADFAHGVLPPMTEKDVPRDLVANAVLLHHAKRDSNPDHDQVIRGILADGLAQKIGPVVEKSGLFGDGFRAIARLLAHREITALDEGRIDYPTRIQLAAPAIEESYA